jgi:hypothetical protein
MPALISFSITSWLWLDGPIVATILALRIMMSILAAGFHIDQQNYPRRKENGISSGEFHS